MMWVHQDPHFSSISSKWKPYTYTDRNNACFRWTNIHSQFGTFSHPICNKASSKCLSLNNPANGCRYKFRSRSTTGSSMFAQDLGHLSWKTYAYISTFLPEDFGQSGRILQFSLGVGWYCISCFVRHNQETLKKTPHYFRGSRLGRRRALFTKNWVGSRTVFHNVSREHDSAFILL